jgi:branched-subunit amino acid ABC-type transport system permease component
VDLMRDDLRILRVLLERGHADRRGLIIGAGEKIAEVFWGDAFGGAIEDWFAYMLAMVFLLFRPQGLFGERIIERV